MVAQEVLTDRETARHMKELKSFINEFTHYSCRFADETRERAQACQQRGSQAQHVQEMLQDRETGSGLNISVPHAADVRVHSLQAYSIAALMPMPLACIVTMCADQCSSAIE